MNHGTLSGGDGQRGGDMLSGLDHLISMNLERGQSHRTERRGQSGIGCVASARHQDAPYARDMMPRIETVPLTTQVHFEPGVEIHWDINRIDADIAKISAAISCRNVHAPA